MVEESSMPFPVRCFTCGKVIGNMWNDFCRRKLDTSKTEGEHLSNMNVKRHCCRRMFLTHVDIDDILLLYDVPDT